MDIGPYMSSNPRSAYEILEELFLPTCLSYFSNYVDFGIDFQKIILERYHQLLTAILFSSD